MSASALCWLSSVVPVGEPPAPPPGFAPVGPWREVERTRSRVAYVVAARPEPTRPTLSEVSITLDRLDELPVGAFAVGEAAARLRVSRRALVLAGAGVIAPNRRPVCS